MYLWHYTLALTICWYFDQNFFPNIFRGTLFLYLSISVFFFLLVVFIVVAFNFVPFLFICKCAVSRATNECTTTSTGYIWKVSVAFQVRFPSGNRLSGQLQNKILAYYFLCDSCLFSFLWYFGGKATETVQSCRVFAYDFYINFSWFFSHPIDTANLQEVYAYWTTENVNITWEKV